jgi:hypothetical protein
MEKEKVEPQEQTTQVKKTFEITKGRIQRPLLILLYGPDKVGKTTFAGSAPSPIFLGAEEGSNELDVARLPKPVSFNDAVEQVNFVASLSEFSTLVVDTLDWLEHLVFQQVVSENEKFVSSISEIPFGKGYPRAYSKWREFIAALETCRDNGKNIILLAHSVVKRFEDPSAAQGYDRYQLKLYDGSATSKTDSTADLFKQYVDSILFANFEVYTNADDPRRAFGDGTRVIFTERRPALDAGNRLGLPFKMPLDFTTFYGSAMSDKAETEKLKTEIKSMIEKVKDEKAKKSALEALPKKITMADLNTMKGRLEAYL